jgi:hypothetical protein
MQSGVNDMSRFKLARVGPLLAALAVGLGGCATLSESNQQRLTVQTVLDNREAFGTGCLLTNDAGRWFVTAPGQVTITRSAAPLTVECSRQAGAMGRALVASRVDAGQLVGNPVTGIAYLVDRQAGAAYAYPSPLTVLMRKGEARGEPPPNNDLY